MKIEATAAAALAAQSAAAAATSITTAAALPEKWWLAVIAAAIGTLFAVHAERAHAPGQLSEAGIRILMLTSFSWVIGAYVGGLPTVPFLGETNPLTEIPPWARSGVVGLFSPYLHAICVALLRRRVAGVADSPSA